MMYRNSNSLTKTTAAILISFNGRQGTAHIVTIEHALTKRELLQNIQYM